MNQAKPKMRNGTKCSLDDNSEIEDNHMYRKPYLSKLYFELSPKHLRLNRVAIANEILRNYYANEKKKMSCYKNGYLNCKRNTIGNGYVNANANLNDIKKESRYPYIVTKMNGVYKRITEKALINDSFYQMQLKHNQMITPTNNNSSNSNTNTNKAALFSTEVKQSNHSNTSLSTNRNRNSNSKDKSNEPFIFMRKANMNIINIPIKRKKLKQTILTQIYSSINENKIKFTELKPVFPILLKEENDKRIKDYEMYDLVYNFKQKYNKH